MNSPIINLGLIYNNNNFYIKRDDLLPFSFGGNKIRIAEEYLDDMIAKGLNCIIGYGNIRSNLCRAIANLSASKKYRDKVKECHIISPRETGDVDRTFNSEIVEKCGAFVHDCDKTNVAQTIEDVVNQCKARGLDPYYINGDKYGKGNEAVPVRAGVKIFDEIHEYCLKNNIKFDYIFIALGTGMTYAGLLCGQSKLASNEKIIGISVARPVDSEKQIIERYLNAYTESQNIGKVSTERILITDEFLCGGYGKYGQSIKATIDEMLLNYGVMLDPTYTGKAFYGMLEYLKKLPKSGSNILFIHTGGTPLFFDYLKTKPVPEFIYENKIEELICFLKAIDKRLPDRLSDRVDFNSYALKINKNGKVVSIKNNNKIIAAVLFYCNDYKTKRAYASLLGTLPEYEGLGYGAALMNEFEIISRENGMEYCCFETSIENNRALALYFRLGYRIEYLNEKVHLIKDIRK